MHSFGSWKIMGIKHVYVEVGDYQTTACILKHPFVFSADIFEAGGHMQNHHSTPKSCNRPGRLMIDRKSFTTCSAA